MDTAVVTGLFTLGGVIVGGVLNNLLAYRLERRRGGWEGKARARLFAPVMYRLVAAMGAAQQEGWTWDKLCVVVESNLDGFWEEFAPTFAGTFADGEWMAVYQAVRPLEQMTHTAARDGTRITSGANAELSRMIDRAVEAAVTLTLVGSRGPAQPQPIRSTLRGLKYRIKPLDEDEIMREAGFDEQEIETLK